MFYNGLSVAARRGALILALLAALTYPFVQSAQAGDFVFPDTPAGQIAKAFYTAFNSGDPEQFKAFTLKYRSTESQAKRPLDERVAQAIGMREQIGELKTRAGQRTR